MVKLTRTLAIIPTVIVFALVQLNLKRKEAMALQQDGSALKAEFSIKKIFPWFILGFLAMSIVASILPIPAQLVSGTKTASNFLMVCALAAIGLNTSLRQHEEGWHPPHDSRFHHFCAGCNCGAAGGDGHGNRVRKLQDN